MSRRGLEGGRKKSLLDPRRHVKCPVSECKYSGRTDHVKRHFRNLIVWSKTYEGEAAEESENVFISAPRDSKQHTKWCRRNGFTKTKMPYFHSKEQPMSSVLNFFSQSSMNNNERPDSAGAGAEMDFYKHVMEQHGSRKCSMKAIVETLASDKVKTFYEKNKHSALGDAETLCRLSNSKAMHDRFRSWVICFNSLIGPAKERIVQKRSQSVQRHYYPG